MEDKISRDNTSTKILLDVSSLLMLYILLIAPLVYTGSVTATNATTLLAAVFCFYYLGAVLLSVTNIRGLVLPFTYSVVSVFFSALIYSMMIFVNINSSILVGILLLITGIFIFIFRKKVSWSVRPNIPDIAAMGIALLAIMLISSWDEFSKLSTATQSGTLAYTPDSYFFTSLVASVRQGSIFSAVYEVNSPINYQLLPFFIPALWADMLHLSSHQALWALASPFYKVMAILLTYELSYYFLKDKVSRTNYWFMLLAVFLPILLAPLHPLYLLKLNIKNFIFNGMGYLVPAGTVTYPLSIALFLLCLLLFCNIDWKSKKISGDKLFFIISFSILVLAKIPIYIAFLFFLGAIVLKRVLFDKENIMRYVGCFLASLLLTYLLFRLCMGHSPLRAKNYFKYGYLNDLFAEWYHKGSKGFVNNLVITGIILYTYTIWIGVKFIGLGALIKTKTKKLNEFAIGALISLLCTTLLASFLRMEAIDKNNHMIADMTFNIQQFIRSGFYLVSIVSSIGILYFFYSCAVKKFYFRAAMFIIITWCAIALTTILYYTVEKMKTTDDQKVAWYDVNYKLLRTGKYNDGLITVNPGGFMYGIMISSSDYGKYWSAMNRTGTNYNSTSKNEYRWDIFERLITHPEEKDLLKMKSEGVKYIISTPQDSSQLTNVSLLFPQHLHKIKETEWIYQID